MLGVVDELVAVVDDSVLQVGVVSFDAEDSCYLEYLFGRVQFPWEQPRAGHNQ